MFLTKKTSKLLAKFLLLLMFISNPACIVAVHAATSTENTALIQDPSSTTFTVDKSATGAVITDDNRIGNENLTEQQKALNFSNHLLNYYLNNGKGHGPQWLKTTDIQFLFTEDHKPIYAVESLQPFGGIKDNGSFWFWQGRYAHESASSSTANLGIGWRKLSADKSSMVGFNTFYDYGFEYNLARIGLGTEYFNKQAEYRFNFYHPVSGERQTGVSYSDSGITTSYIRAVEGFDFEAGTSFTYMPWLKVYAGGYYWDNKYHDDEKGYRLRSMLELGPRVNMELGYLHSNLNHSLYGKINYQLAFDSMSDLSGNSQKKKINTNDVSSKLLQKVQRENDIKTETYTKFAAYKGNIRTTVTNSMNSTALVGAVVQVYQNGSAVGSAVTTDSGGNAVISELNTRTYTVLATYGSVTGTSSAITVTKDQTTPAVVSLAVIGGSATVTVVDSSATAVSGASITATLASTTIAKAEKSLIDTILGIKSAYAASSSFSVTLITDANGVATFTNLPPGIYNFTVTSNGRRMESQQIAVASGNTSSANVILPNSGGNLEVTVKDGSGTVVSEASVAVSLSGGTPTSQTTGSDGIAKFSGLAAGTYTVSITKDGYTGNTVSVTITSGVTATNTVSVTRQIGNANITVNDGTTELGGATVTVTVNGTPQTQTTNASGVASFTNLPVGIYTFSATKNGYSTVVSGNVSIANVATSSATISLSIQTFAITLNAGSNGTIAGSTSVAYGTNPNYTITANAGYNIASITVDGSSVTVTGSPQSYNFTNITGIHTIAATFALQTFGITVNQGANGTIAPVSGSNAVNYGATPQYTITPSTGYAISDVKVDGVSVGAVAMYTFPSVGASHIITANFAVQTFEITLNAGSNGTIAGSTSIAYGTSASYTITANAGYQIASIRVDESSETVTGSPMTMMLTNVKRSHVIVVNYAVVTTVTFKYINLNPGCRYEISSTIDNETNDFIGLRSGMTSYTVTLVVPSGHYNYAYSIINNDTGKQLYMLSKGINSPEVTINMNDI